MQANVLVTSSGSTAVLADFGLAQLDGASHNSKSEYKYVTQLMCILPFFSNFTITLTLFVNHACNYNSSPPCGTLMPTSPKMHA